MTLPEFAQVVSKAYPNTYHYRAEKEKGDYAVWHEYGGDRQDGGPLEIHAIQLDLFTHTEFAPALKTIERALDAAGIARRKTKTAYEVDTGYIHHILLCEVVDRG